ncbi:unnamed protein product [Acanthoscelides obtectus]|uniref:K Homology domain-containing protein n=1 Tax=Acanthoscelides obtectus TaxID=200917 RepID=A0A9P0PC73_ACAOB|nr:unnamed protein product [Acanthoscelides obtectus]CAK1657758.1 Far upstream element-binding protein 3 [Acanthoscelides obtectus]
MSDYSSVAPPQQNFNQSTAFAAALQRAKQIAAKINPGTGNSAGDSRKRPLEDGSGPEPEAKKGPGMALPQGRPSSQPPQQQQNQGAPPMNNSQFNDDQNLPGGLRLNNMNNMGGGKNTLEIMIPGPKVGLIIGKGGETIKQLQEKSGAKMVVIQDGPNQELEKPLLISGDAHKVEYAKQMVYDLIAEKEMKNFGRRGGGGGRNDGRGPQEFGEFGGGGGQGNDLEVLVPRAAVGVVIGKGGEMIKKIQAETGARVQFHQARDEGPGDRRCFLNGNPKQVDMARQRIEELIDSVMQRDNGGGDGPNRGGRGGGRGGPGGPGGGPGGRFDRNGGGQWEDRRGGHHGQDVVTFCVPANKCGVIIGRGGETIKQINSQSGAYCELDRRNQSSNPNEKYFTIKGDPEQIESAKRIISDKIQMPINLMPVGGPGGMGNNIPTAYPGMAPQPAPQGGGYPGPGGGWGMPGGYQPQQQWGGQGGGGDAPGGQQQPSSVQVNPSTGQPDYSMQWAEYYRSLGMHREAEMIEQQAKAKAAGGGGGATNGAVGAASGAPAPGAAGPGAPGGAAAGGGQADYSAQWAEYYRSMGKVKEAEAIEAQMKNKGGSQAAGGTAPPGTTGAPGAGAAGNYQAQAFGGYQGAAAGGYYGGQGQGAPGSVPQAGYFPGYNYGAQQGGNSANSQDN